MRKSRTNEEAGPSPATTADGTPGPRRGRRPCTDTRGGGGPGAGSVGVTCAAVRAFFADAARFSCRQRAAFVAHARDCDQCFVLALDQFVADLPPDLRAAAEAGEAGGENS